MKKIALALLPIALAATACTVERTVYDPPRTTEYRSYAVTPGTPAVYSHTEVQPDGSTMEYQHVVRPYTTTEYSHVETDYTTPANVHIDDEDAR